MNTVRFASLVATFAFGLMGCATEGLGRPHAAGISPTASYDPSSFYQPSPNAAPLAVEPSRTVTGAVGGSFQKVAPASNGPSASLAPASFYEPSPNFRLTPPSLLTASAGGAQAASATGLTASYAPASFYAPSSNSPMLLTAPGLLSNGNGMGAASCSVAGEEGMPGVSPNVRLCP